MHTHNTIYIMPGDPYLLLRGVHWPYKGRAGTYQGQAWHLSGAGLAPNRGYPGT